MQKRKPFWVRILAIGFIAFIPVVFLANMMKAKGQCLQAKSVAMPVPQFAEMQILAKTLTGKTVTLSVQIEDSIAWIKTELSSKIGIPVDKQHLTFAGKRLENGYTALEYGIQRGQLCMSPLVCAEAVSLRVTTQTARTQTALSQIRCLRRSGTRRSRKRSYLEDFLKKLNQ